MKALTSPSIRRNKGGEGMMNSGGTQARLFTGPGLFYWPRIHANEHELKMLVLKNVIALQIVNDLSALHQLVHQAVTCRLRCARFNKAAPPIRSSITAIQPPKTMRRNRPSCSSTTRSERPARIKPEPLPPTRFTTLAMRTPGRGCHVTFSLP